MLDEPGSLPEDPDDLRSFAARLLAEVKSQAVLIEKLRHQLGVQRVSDLLCRRPSVHAEKKGQRGL